MKPTSIEKLVKIESDITELKNQSSEYNKDLHRLREFFSNETNNVGKATEIANELNWLSQKIRATEIKIDLLEQVKAKIIIT